MTFDPLKWRPFNEPVEAPKIVQDLSSIYPPLSDFYDKVRGMTHTCCLLCGAEAEGYRTLEAASGHESSCPWARAVILWSREKKET